MDATKDNLKNFIERWEEHPNSPYVFDVEGNVIAPLNETEYKKPHGPDSISSSRGEYCCLTTKMAKTTTTTKTPTTTKITPTATLTKVATTTQATVSLSAATERRQQQQQQLIRSK